MPHDPWKFAVMYGGVRLLPELRRMGRLERLAVMKAASDISLSNPLHIMPGRRWRVDGIAGSLCSAEVTAILVFGLWVEAGECANRAAMLLRDWPIIATTVVLVNLAEPMGSKQA